MEKQNRQASGPATENDPTSQSYNWAITPPRRQRKAGGQILSINSGKCVDAEWTQRRGRTAIEKRALTSSCTVTELGIQGDEQAADFHGGRLQAVYAYAREDLDWWSDELGRPLRNGMFGENLDLTGFDVSGAALGERWQAGEVLLEVMAPRMACGTFGAWMGETGWAKRFNDARRPGAYLRVVREGKLSVDDSVHMVWQPQQRVTVAESVGAILGDHEVLRRIHALAEQVPAWDKTAMMFHVSNRTNAKAKGSGETLTSVPPGGGVNVAFELHDDFNAQDPRLALAESAKGCPYRWEPKKQTLYVFGAEEVRSILISDGFWSERSDDCRGSQLSKAEKERRAKLREFYGLWPIFSDGDRHKWARHVTIRLLRDTATPELFGTFERLAHELLSEAGEDAFDWTERIAQPLAHEAAAALTGRRDTGQLLDLTGAVMHELAAPDIDTTRIDRALEAVDSIRDWLGAHLQHPTSPVIAGLAKVWHGENAGPDCATALLTQLVTGSYEPTLTALCVAGELNTTSINAEFPVQNLREEVFRLATPFRFASRYARRPVSIGPHRLGTGDRVTVCLGTANLDPRLYPEPLEIAQRRGRPHSFSFGLGKHLCPGAPMARAVVDALLTAMMRLDVRFAVEKVEREPELPMLRYRQLKGRLRPAARKARPA